MGFNGSGAWTRLYNWVNDANAGIKITASRFDAEMNDMANNGLAACLTRDGQGSASANLPMNTFKHTGVGNATARDQYAAAGQIQDGGFVWATAGGTADALTATYAPAITTLVDGMKLGLRAASANATTTPTFAPNGLTAHTITKKGGTALVAGDIAGAGHELILTYNLANTRWELLTVAPPTGAIVGTTDPQTLTNKTLTTPVISSISNSGTITLPAGTDTLVARATTDTLTNKRITARVQNNGVTTSGSITPTADTCDQFNLIGLTGAITVAAPSGTPTDGQKLVLRFKDNGTARGITWTTSSGGYRSCTGTTLPTTTVISSNLYVGCIYNATDSFWDVVAVSEQ